MPEIAPRIHLNLPGEQHSPYQWGGEATHGQTNPIRNYMDACQDAAEAAPFLADDDDGGVPSTQYWQTQVREAERIVEAFDDIGADGIPTVIPREFVELQQKLRVERPDLHTELSIDRNGLPADADEFNMKLGTYAVTERFKHASMRPQVETTQWRFRSDDSTVEKASGWSTSYQQTEPHDVGTRPWEDWDRAEEFTMSQARALPGQWQGGRLDGVPQYGAVVVGEDGEVEHLRRTDWTVQMSTLIHRDAEPVALAGDVTMWIHEDPDTELPVNKTASNVAAEFGVNHRSYQGAAVFTGGVDEAGNVAAFDREQLAAVEEIADYYAVEPHQRNPRWPSTRGSELVDTFDTRAKNGLPTTLEAAREAEATAQQNEQERIVIASLQQPTSTASGPGVS